MEMASDAYVSLLGMIHDLLFSCRISVASSTQDILFSTFSYACSLGCALESCGEGVTSLDERKIMEVARLLEDEIEFSVSIQFVSQSESVDDCPPTFSLDLHHLREHVHSFAVIASVLEQYVERLWKENAEKMIQDDVMELCMPKTKKLSPSEEEDVLSDCEMVGLSDEFSMIRDKLAPTVWEGITVWVSGMAGIGKTALATKIFHDPWLSANYFECRAFVRVGRNYSAQQLLQAITAQLNPDNDKMIKEGDDEDIRESFLRILTDRKCLVVLDDVWDNSVLDDLLGLDEDMSRIYDKGSRILVTSRKDLPNQYYYKMRFMNEEESWELLKRKAFGEEEECPHQLEKAGRKIAEKCEGLPLLIITVAATLVSKFQKNLERWKEVAEKPDSVLEDASYQIYEVLLSSYHQLSIELKLCFLYIAAFPRNHVILRSSIFNLWTAERLLGPTKVSYSNSLSELLNGNLVMGSQKSWSSDRVKAFTLHSAYWYVSQKVAKGNRFLYTINSYNDGLDKRIERQRRLAIYNKVVFAIKEVHSKIASVSTLRSLLCTGLYHQYQVPICFELKLLRVLDAVTVRFYEFPVEVVRLIRLKYLALTCDEDLPPSISKLWNLQFLIVRQHSSIKRVWAYVPMEIWDLQELIHLEISGRNLPHPPRPGTVFPNLKKLLGVGDESCNKGVLESMPKLEKLRVEIELDEANGAQTLYCFDDYVFPCLHDQISFQFVILNTTLSYPPPPLSISTPCLGKLSLSGFGYPWEDMSKIAELRSLRVLKLQNYAFQGEKWEAEEMRFRGLRHLLIEDTDLVQWTAGDETFPWLKKVTMRNCYLLQETPHMFPSSLFKIELVDCDTSAETRAKERYGAQRVTATYSWMEQKN